VDADRRLSRAANQREQKGHQPINTVVTVDKVT